MKSELCVSGRKQWRSWLKRNHATAREVWLVYYKKHTGKPTVTYSDSVEEALCFGWIDGLKKRIDEQRYAHRFTSRKSGSKWSPVNIKLAKRMLEEGKMTPAGLAAFNRRVIYDEDFLKASDAKEIRLTSDIEKALMANKKAWKNLNNLAPSYRKQETRDRRVKEAIKLLAGNKKLGMK